MFHDYSPAAIADLPVRWEKVQKLLQKTGADGMLVASRIGILYLSGRVYRGYLYLPAIGAPLYFVQRPIGLQGEHVYAVRKPEQIPDLLTAEKLVPNKVLLEADDLTHGEWLRLSALFPNAQIENGSSLLRIARSVKTPYECKLLKLTGSRHVSVIDQFAMAYEPGMTDQQWLGGMYKLLLDAGCLGVIRTSGITMEGFVGSVLVGPNGGGKSPFDYALGGAGLSPSLPVGQSGVKMERGMSALVDIPANFFGYISDCTRNYSVGKLPQRALDAHKVALEIEQTIMEMGKPGVSCEALYQKSLEIAEKRGFADCYMGAEQKARFVGHGVGLVMNEWPVLGARSKHVLEENQFIAVEPKLVIDGVGPVGNEDTFVVTKKGMVSITENDSAIRELSF